MSQEHSKLRIEHEDNAEDIDAQLAPLVLEIWKAGIDIWHSCQGFEGEEDDDTYKSYCLSFGTDFGFIQFPTQAVRKFLTILLQDFSETEEGISFYQRALLHCNNYDLEDMVSDISEENYENSWLYETVLWDMGETYEDLDIYALTSVYFSKSEIPHMLKQLKKHNGEPDSEDTPKAAPKVKATKTVYVPGVNIIEGLPNT